MTTKREILDLAKKQGVSFLRLQFTDILGVNKNVEVPESQFEKALEGDIMFDGSSIEGFVRIEESDMVLKPDLDTFRVLPYDDEGGRVARVICDIYNPDGSAFAGCTRRALKEQIAKANELGYAMMAGVEAPTAAEAEILLAYLQRYSQRPLDPNKYPAVNLPEGQSFKLACQQCHVLPDPQRHKASEWPAVVARMEKNMEWMNRVVGNQPDPREIQLKVEEINAFLVKYARRG